MPTANESVPNISIIIVAWNSWSFLDPSLQLLTESNSGKQEIIIVDNASSDGTVAKVKGKYPQCRILENPSNLGHAPALNQGIGIAQGKFIMVLDADAEIAPGVVTRLTDFLAEHPEVSIVAPRLLNSDGTIQENVKAFPKVRNALFGRQSLLTRMFPGNRLSGDYLLRRHRDQKEPFEADYVSAACMVFRKDLAEKIGLWDVANPSYWVDADWCMRTRKAGGKVYCLPTARAVHHEQNRQGRRKGMLRIVLFHRGVFRFYRRYYTAGRFDPRIPLAFIFLVSRAALLLLCDPFLPSSTKPMNGMQPERLKEQGS